MVQHHVPGQLSEVAQRGMSPGPSLPPWRWLLTRSLWCLKLKNCLGHKMREGSSHHPSLPALAGPGLNLALQIGLAKERPASYWAIWPSNSRGNRLNI